MRKHYLIWAILGGAVAALAAPIRDIRVVQEGEAPVSVEQVLAHVSARVGGELDRAALSDDIRALQRSGAYALAEARVEPVADGGVVLAYHVTGRPRIRHLRISGAERMGNRKVRNLMELGSGDLADDAVIGERTQAVRDAYRKDYHPEAKLDWTLHPVEDAPGFVDLDIHVKEGRRAIVRRIRFEGVRNVRAKELRAAMVQRQSSWLSWFNQDGMYLPGSLAMDRDAVRQVLLDKGYLAAQVGEPDIRYVGRRKIDVTFPVEQGPLFSLADWRITGMTTFPPEAVERGVVAASGRPAAMATIRRSAQNIRDFYGSRGYIQTGVEPRLQLDPEAATATVAYDVTEGMQAFIQHIDIRGNAQTKDKVIRREIGVKPGEVFNEVRVRASESRVRNLGYFSFVNAYPEATAVSNRFNLVMDVEEQRTGQFMLGAGFSSVDNLIGFVELTQGNFDLFGWPRFTGGGQRLRLRAQAGAKRSDLELSLIEPWFLNRRLSLGLDLFRRDARYFSRQYEQVTTGGSLTLGRPLFAFNRINFIYGLEDIDIRNVSTNASWLIQEEAVSRLKSYGAVELIRDTRNHPFLASRGFRGSASATLAGGPFGGDTDTYQFSLRGSQFVPLLFDHVLNLRGWTSMIQEYGDSDRVPLFDRLFLGGPRSVRAARFRHAGPKDDRGEPIGGRTAASASVEYTLPVVDKIRLAVFYDVGVVWQDIYRKGDAFVELPSDSGDSRRIDILGDGQLYDGYGVGIRFDIPGFPIQLDYAWPLTTDDITSTKGRFVFSIGYSY